MARNLDLNSLDSLSRTCHILHSALLQDRRGLINSSLRCSLEDVTVDPQDTLRFRARSANWYYGQDSFARTDFQGKSGQCARDMVGPCRRCGTIVCRVSSQSLILTAATTPDCINTRIALSNHLLRSCSEIDIGVSAPNALRHP